MNTCTPPQIVAFLKVLTNPAETTARFKAHYSFINKLEEAIEQIKSMYSIYYSPNDVALDDAPPLRV